MTGPRLWLPPMLSAWGIDKSPMSGLWCIIICRKNMESYYQEAGRAREGMVNPQSASFCTAAQDVVTNQFFIDHNQDNEALDPITREIVMERDRERLRKMTFYCFTNECLRRLHTEIFLGVRKQLLRQLLQLPEPV